MLTLKQLREIISSNENDTEYIVIIGWIAYDITGLIQMLHDGVIEYDFPANLLDIDNPFDFDAVLELLNSDYTRSVHIRVGQSPIYLESGQDIVKAYIDEPYDNDPDVILVKVMGHAMNCNGILKYWNNAS